MAISAKWSKVVSSEISMSDNFIPNYIKAINEALVSAGKTPIEVSKTIQENWVTEDAEGEAFDYVESANAKYAITSNGRMQVLDEAEATYYLKGMFNAVMALGL